MFGRRIPMIVMNKTVGYYYPDSQVYTKSVDYYKHRSVVMSGWGIQKDIVGRLKKHGCKEVRMFVTKSGESYLLVTSFKNYLIHGEDRELNPLEGMQTFLHDQYWKRRELPE